MEKTDFIILPANPSDYEMIIFLMTQRGKKSLNLFTSFALKYLLLEPADWPRMDKKTFLIFRGKSLIGFSGFVIFKDHYLQNLIWYIAPDFRFWQVSHLFDGILKKICEENNIKKERRISRDGASPEASKFNEISQWYSTYGQKSAITLCIDGKFEIRYAEEKDLINLTEFLQKTKTYEKSSRVFLENIIFFPLDLDSFKEIIVRRRMIIAYKNDKFCGFCIFNISEHNELFPYNLLEICYFDGEVDLFFGFINFLRNSGCNWALIKINVINQEFLDRFLKLGFSCNFLNKLEKDFGGGKIEYSYFLTSKILERELIL